MFSAELVTKLLDGRSHLLICLSKSVVAPVRLEITSSLSNDYRLFSVELLRVLLLLNCC